jgi:hypothetical protein
VPNSPPEETQPLSTKSTSTTSAAKEATKSTQTTLKTETVSVATATVALEVNNAASQTVDTAVKEAAKNTEDRLSLCTLPSIAVEIPPVPQAASTVSLADRANSPIHFNTAQNAVEDNTAANDENGKGPTMCRPANFGLNFTDEELQKHNKRIRSYRQCKDDNKKRELCCSIVDFYMNTGNFTEMFIGDFEQFVEENKRECGRYDFDFADNFENLWSYGILAYANEIRTRKEHIEKEAVNLNLTDNFWEWNSNERCIKALKLLKPLTNRRNAAGMGKPIVEVSSDVEMEKYRTSSDERECSRILMKDGHFYIAFVGRIIRVMPLEGMHECVGTALSLYIALHYFFAMHFPGEHELAFRVLTVATGLRYSKTQKLKRADIDVLTGARKKIRENIHRFDDIDVQRFQWSLQDAIEFSCID